MTKQERQQSGDVDAPLRVNPKRHWADIEREIRHAFMETRQPTLRWLHVRASAERVVLSGQVYTRREFCLATYVAECHAHGMPITNQIVIWAETTSRVNE